VVASNSPAATGSIIDISQRLALWAQRDIPSLMRVEYSSEFARQRVMADLQNRLNSSPIACHEIILPSYQDPEGVMQFLLDHLAQLPAGVVSITGFATAFSTQLPLKEVLRVVNFNRERLAAFPLRQVWWMTPVFLQTAIHAMPDLDSWFTARLHLTEVVFAPSSPLSLPATEGSTANIDDAHDRAQRLIQQFEAARTTGASDLDLLQTYLLPALEALAEANAQKELHDLTTQFEGLLGQLKLINSPDMATSLGRLAYLYYLQGRYGEAEPLYQKALVIREKQLGPNHPNVATSLNNLANLYESQGRYGEAEPLLLRALAISEQQLGKDHPDVATSLNNLAGLYHSQGRYEEAEPLLLRALAIGEQQLGKDYPDVATWLNNLAELYRSQGRYEEAEPLLLRALAISEQQLGKDHPTVATNLNNLALLYRSQGRYEEAEPLFLQALAISEQQLGKDHPDMATWLNNLAELYQSQRRYGKAERLYLRALEILFDRLGTDHPNTRTVWRNFLTFLQQAIQAGQTTQLSDHPLTQDLLRQLQQTNVAAE
jgi:tetratricopeptide (TPR) repeat protein